MREFLHADGRDRGATEMGEGFPVTKHAQVVRPICNQRNPGRRTPAAGKPCSCPTTVLGTLGRVCGWEWGRPRSLSWDTLQMSLSTARGPRAAMMLGQSQSCGQARGPWAVSSRGRHVRGFCRRGNRPRDRRGPVGEFSPRLCCEGWRGSRLGTAQQEPHPPHQVPGEGGEAKTHEEEALRPGRAAGPQRTPGGFPCLP